jgi:DNA invertase Pin-like site-specific DNA recombinase
MENETKKPREVLLYRASSKKQTDDENDIPLQRQILRPWVEKNGWQFCREFVEGGVSGYKIRAEKRDAVQEIKAMAERGEFDILGIYYSDRLGRIADETPLIVSFLNAHKIQVISYCEGNISSESHSEKLMTYIRYWQAEGESLKTSTRCSDAVKQCVMQGRWRGGIAPFGYRSVSRGTLNFKGEPIKDVEIDPEAAAVVRDIFDLYTNEHYGTRKIAKTLNDSGRLTNRGKLWDSGLILKILKNRLYTGVYELHKYVPNKERLNSPVMQDFVIVEPERFVEAQLLMPKREKGHGANRRPTNHGALLLTGMVFCGGCGRKFTSHCAKARRVRSDGKVWNYEKHKYRCGSFMKPVEGKPCMSRLYDAKELEALIIADAKDLVRHIDRERILEKHRNDSQIKAAEAVKRVERIEADVAKKTREIQKLKDEVMKVIMGESAFGRDMLTEMLAAKEVELTQLTETLSDANNAVLELDAEISAQKHVAKEILTWPDRFDAAPQEEKKAMLINIIDRVTVTGDIVEARYKIKVNRGVKLSLINPVIPETDTTADPATDPADYAVAPYDCAATNPESAAPADYATTAIKTAEPAEINPQNTAFPPKTTAFPHTQECVKRCTFGGILVRSRPLKWVGIITRATWLIRSFIRRCYMVPFVPSNRNLVYLMIMQGSVVVRL